jgi:hypothetical protein
MNRQWIIRSGCIVTIALLAGCTPPPPPAPPPAPPPPVIILPTPAPAPMPMPVPPNQAAPNLVIPITDVTGRRLTPHVDLSPQQALWHLRIGLNVAALNCRGPDEQILVNNYSAFLRNNRAAIAAAERWVIRDLGTRNGTNGIAVRDTLSTRLYNYFAQPPVHDGFCAVATRIAAAAAVEPTANILNFAPVRLAELDQPFVDFYAAYSRYQIDYATWQAQQPASVMPAYVPASSVPAGPVAGPTAGMTGGLR